MKAQINVIALVVMSVLLSLNACKSGTSLADRPSPPREQKQESAERPTSGQITQINGQKRQEIQDGRQSALKLTGEQAKALLEREFSGLFQIDEQNISPSYLVGDFNGDGVEDIVLNVRLNRDLEQSDESKPPFWFYKPFACSSRPIQDGTSYQFTMGDLARYRDEPILIVIHGTREHGWNNSQPQQKFVIVDAMNRGTSSMRLYRGKLKSAAIGDADIESPPHLYGDAILLSTPESSGAAVIWNGTAYCWYPADEVPK